MNFDRFETPGALADEIVSMAQTRAPRVIGDLAAGRGALLAAAERRWPKARVVANDVDRGLAASMRYEHPTWTVGACDLLSSYLRRRSTLRDFEGAIDLIVLNPPFSDRGGHARHLVTLAGAEVRTTRAIAFVIESISWLSLRGEIVAIVPAGSLTSERDRPALRLLADLGDLTVKAVERDDLFAGCRVRVSLLRFVLGRRPPTTAPPSPASSPVGTPRFRFFRGQISASRREAGRHGLIHSTSLQGGKVDALRRTAGGRLHTEPMVVLPRVGKPRADKLALWDRGEVAISDCILAIAGGSSVEMEALLGRMRENFERLSALYCGSCAPYLTLARLAEFVEAIDPPTSAVRPVEALAATR